MLPKNGFHGNQKTLQQMITTVHTFYHMFFWGGTEHSLFMMCHNWWSFTVSHDQLSSGILKPYDHTECIPGSSRVLHMWEPSCAEHMRLVYATYKNVLVADEINEKTIMPLNFWHSYMMVLNNGWIAYWSFFILIPEFVSIFPNINS